MLKVYGIQAASGEIGAYEVANDWATHEGDLDDYVHFMQCGNYEPVSEDDGDEAFDAIRHNLYTRSVGHGELLGWRDVEGNVFAEYAVECRSVHDVVFGLNDSPIHDHVGGAVRVSDGVTDWWCSEAEWRRVVEWSKGRPACPDDAETYEAFCQEFRGYTGNETVTLKARYAAATYDMTSEAGREAALREVFRGSADDLGFACMTLDEASEAD